MSWEFILRIISIKDPQFVPLVASKLALVNHGVWAI